MDTKVKGIIIKLTDYKEADKLASVFSYEQGIITAKFTGVKKDKAKFKSIAQLFCLADFVLNQKGNTFQVTSAEVIDNFFNITQDYLKTTCACVVLDIIKTILPPYKSEPEIFLQTITCLKDIEISDAYIATINYILKFFSLTGMDLELLNTNYVYLDKNTGNFSPTKNANSVQIDKKVYNLIKQIGEGNIPQDNINTNTCKQCLQLLHNIIYLKYGEDIKSFQYLV